MNLVAKQWAFLKDIARLVLYVDSAFLGVMMTAGEFYESPDETNPEHLRDGAHPKRLAADINLFVNGIYTETYHPIWENLGNFWKSLSPENRWGGDWKSRDYNHFERH